MKPESYKEGIEEELQKISPSRSAQCQTGRKEDVSCNRKVWHDLGSNGDVSPFYSLVRGSWVIIALLIGILMLLLCKYTGLLAAQFGTPIRAALCCQA